MAPAIRRADGDPSVVVVGSLNLDVVVRTPSHPRPGETVLGHDHAEYPGGKGANQAVAAARLGARTAMLGRVGDDAAADRLRTSLAEAGVDLTALLATPGVRTGAAFITVDDAGENTIVVSSGANARLSAADVDAQRDLLASADVCLLQLEVADEVVRQAVRATGGRVVLNPAPARDLPSEVLAGVDVLVPNEGELALLAGRTESASDPDELAALARSLAVPTVVVTLGARGALVVADERVEHLPAPEVEVVDTTAAGDTFCGALAAALVRGDDVVTATRWAVAASALSVQQEGAQPSIPTLDEMEEAHRAT